MHPPPIYFLIDPPFTHDTLYQFWVQSEGLLVNDLTLVTTNGEAEERTILDRDSRRLRELRTGDELLKRLWENRYSA